MKSSETASEPSSGTLEVRGRFRDLPLEEVPCYVCGAQGGKLLVDDPPFKVWRCESCGFGYTSPRIDGTRIHEIYDGSYWSSDSAKDFGYSDYRADIPGYKKSFRLKARTIAKHIPKKARVLELGCAAGYFLDAMRELGHEVHGVEVSQAILDSARERFQLENLHCGRLDEIELEAGSFDLIALWDVIEHVSDPREILNQCHGLLRDEGRLVLQTQDVASLARRVLGSKWHHFKQLEHIYHFTPATIAKILESSGFEVERLTHRHAGKYVSFAFLKERLRRFGWFPGLIGNTVGLLGRRFLYVNPFDEMIVVARKSAAED